MIWLGLGLRSDRADSEAATEAERLAGGRGREDPYRAGLEALRCSGLPGISIPSRLAATERVQETFKIYHSNSRRSFAMIADIVNPLPHLSIQYPGSAAKTFKIFHIQAFAMCI